MNTGEQLQDKDLSLIVEPVETIQSRSGTEVAYSEILDVTIRNQVVRDYRLQEIQPLGLLTSHNCDDVVLEFVHVETSKQVDLDHFTRER